MSSFSELLFANWNLESMKINFQFDSISALRADIMMTHQLIPNPNPPVTCHSFNSYLCQSINVSQWKKIKFSRPFRHAVLWKCKSSSWEFVDSSGKPWKVLADSSKKYQCCNALDLGCTRQMKYDNKIWALQWESPPPIFFFNDWYWLDAQRGATSLAKKSIDSFTEPLTL